MIDNILIEGFKSFGMGGAPVRLGRLNFLVGANASGKTNFLSALRFLKQAVQTNVQIAADSFGGVPEIRNKILRERQEAKPLRIKITLDRITDAIKMHKPLYEIQALSYDLKVNVRKSDQAPEVEEEHLIADICPKGESAKRFELKRSKDTVEIIDPTRKTPADKPIPVPAEETTRLAMAVGFYSFPCVVLRTYIENWSFFNINPSLARMPYKEATEADLGSAGESLSVILHRIEKENGKGSLETILSGLRGAVPGFKGIKTTLLPVENKWVFQVVEERIRAINPESVSDGTIRLLALMVIAMWSSKHSTFVAIEEPENGLHPHLSEHIVSVLKQASEHRQLLVTTHNPSFLDFLTPDQLLLCDKTDGFSKIKSAADIEEVNKFKSRFRLGEQWVQGVLGGVL